MGENNLKTCQQGCMLCPPECSLRMFPQQWPWLILRLWQLWNLICRSTQGRLSSGKNVLADLLWSWGPKQLQHFGCSARSFFALKEAFGERGCTARAPCQLDYAHIQGTGIISVQLQWPSLPSWRNREIFQPESAQLLTLEQPWSLLYRQWASCCDGPWGQQDWIYSMQVDLIVFAVLS